MHLFTHLRAKTALLISGALLWCGSAMADVTDSIPEGYRVLKYYDFTVAPLTSIGSLTVSSETPGYLCSLNNGKYVYFAVYNCTTSGMETFVFQDVSSEKGYKITSGKGLIPTQERVAGLTGLKVGQVVDIYTAADSIYSGHKTTHSGSNTGKDCSAKKNVLINEGGHARFEMTEAGILPFQPSSKQKYIYKIIVSEPNTGIPTPEISVAGNSYGWQTVTITASTGDIYYTITTGEETSDEVQYTAPFSISKTSTITVWAKSGEEKSEEESIEVVAGEVPTPTIYAATNSNTVSISSSIANSTITYQLGDDAEITYEWAFDITEDSDITAWVTYTENGKSFVSPKKSLSAVVVSGSLQSDLNLKKAAWSDVTNDKTEVTVGTNSLFTSGGTSFTTATVLAKQINGLYVAIGSAWLKRVSSGNGGLYLSTANTVKVAIPNIQEGKIVEVSGCAGATDPFSLSASVNGELDELRSVVGSKYVFRCSGNGNLILELTKNCYIDEVKIYGNDTISITSKLNANTNVGTFYWSRTVAIPEGVKAFVGTLNDAQTEFTLSEISDFIPANTPVIINAPGKTEVTFTAVDDIVAAITTNSLQGQLESVATSDIEGAVWVISSKETDGSDFGLYKYTGENITANRAYLVLSETATEAPAIHLTGDWNVGNVTGIESLTAEKNQAKAIFDIQGRQVLNTNLPGLYIMGGRKVLVK